MPNSPISSQKLTLFAPDERYTEKLAELLSPLVCYPSENIEKVGNDTHHGGHIHLIGELGAGKTSFTRAFLRHAGVKGRIKSPSYGLLESYNLSSFVAYHLDFYRFNDENEWLDAGFRDMLQEEKAVVLIEWPDKAGRLLPPPDLAIHFHYHESGRDISLVAYSEKGKIWLKTLEPHLKEFPAQA